MTVDTRPEAAFLAEQQLMFPTALEKTVHPHPRDEPQPQLERTGPVDTEREGILVKPRHELAINELRIALVFGQSVGQGRERQMLMAVEFPDVARVAHETGIPAVDQRPKVERNRDTALGIVVPPDVIQRERLAESREPSIEEATGLLDNVANGLGRVVGRETVRVDHGRADL